MRTERGRLICFACYSLTSTEAQKKTMFSFLPSFLPCFISLPLLLLLLFLPLLHRRSLLSFMDGVGVVPLWLRPVRGKNPALLCRAIAYSYCPNPEATLLLLNTCSSPSYPFHPPSISWTTLPQHGACLDLFFLTLFPPLLLPLLHSLS